MEVEREAALSTSHQPVQEAPPSTSHQPVRWLKRDSDGNVVHDRPRSYRNQIASHSYSRKTGAPTTMLDSSVERTNYCPPDTVESFLEELNHSQGDDMDDQETAPAPPRASLDWSTRRSLLSERWAKERPRLVNTMVAQQNTETGICQQCGSSPAAVRCRDCRPHPLLCAECDVSLHRNQVFHNRDATIAGFFQPLPPTTCVVERVLSQCVCILPLEMPEKLCTCSPGTLSVTVNPGKVVAVVTINGRYDLSMPEMKCKACKATWSAGVDDLVRNDYWPATLTLHFSTVYSTDVVHSCEESEEQALFDGIFIAKDDEVERFVDYIHSTTNHVSGRGVCGGECRLEVLVASIKRRSQRLYKDTDGSKGRARIRRKIREEKAILGSVADKYNSMVPDAERIDFDSILSEETVWPWQLSHGDNVDLKTKRKAFDVVMAIRRLEEERKIVIAEMAKHWKSLSTPADTLKEMSCRFSSEPLQSELWGLNEEGIKGLRSLTLKKKQAVTTMMKHARDCCAQVLTGTSMDFQRDWDGYDSDSEMSDE
ncbi:unnamed protein product [Arctogadus glacialis]